MGIFFWFIGESMEQNVMDGILIDIVAEFLQPQNMKILDSQKLGSSIFFSFAIGVLNNDDVNDEKIENLKYCIRWIQDHKDLFEHYGEKDEV